MEPTIIETKKSAKIAAKTIVETGTEETTILEGGRVPDAGNVINITVLAPGTVIADCRLEEPLKVTSGEADLWIGTRVSDHRKVVIKVYRWRMKPKLDVREKVTKVAVQHVVELLGHGQLEDERYYEILEYIEHGTLADFARDGLSDAMVKEILRELAEAISSLHAENIIHRDVKPDNVLLRCKKPLDLVLTDFGISSVTTLSLHQTSLNRTAAYASPESLSGVIGKASDWWSLGVIMLEILDKNPFAGIDERTINHALMTQGISVPATLDKKWQLLLKGLLTRDDAKRWGAQQVMEWLDGKSDIKVYYEEAQAAYAAQAEYPYNFAGKTYRTTMELGEALIENRDEAIKHLSRGLINDWVSKDVHDQEMALRIIEVVEDVKLTGNMKTSVACMILNRNIPVTLNGEVINMEWMSLHHEDAVKILESSMPEWTKQLRKDTWLMSLRTRRMNMLNYIRQSGISCNQELVDKMIMSKGETIQALAEEIINMHVGSFNNVLSALFSKKSLSDEEKILLVACDRKLLVTKAQWKSWQLEAQNYKEKAQKLGIRIDVDLLSKAVTFNSAELRKEAALLKNKYSNTAVEALQDILNDQFLTDDKSILLIASERSQLFTKEQWKTRESERLKNETKELAHTLGISIDDNLFDNAIKMYKGSFDDDRKKMMNELNKLRNKYASASIVPLRRLLYDDKISDQESILLLSATRNLFTTHEQLSEKRAELKKRENICMGIGATIGAAIGFGVVYGYDLTFTFETKFIAFIVIWLIGAGIGSVKQVQDAGYAAAVIGAITAIFLNHLLGISIGAIIGAILSAVIYEVMLKQWFMKNLALYEDINE